MKESTPSSTISSAISIPARILARLPEDPKLLRKKKLGRYRSDILSWIKNRPNGDPELRRAMLAAKVKGFYQPLTHEQLEDLEKGKQSEFKHRPLTHKEHAYVDLVLAGKGKTAAAMQAYNLTSKKQASVTAARVENRPIVRSEIERRMKAQEINLDFHLRNINDLAVNAEKEDIRLRASQDLLDRGGVHYKYYADDGKLTLQTELSENELRAILNNYEPLPQIETIEGELVEDQTNMNEETVPETVAETITIPVGDEAEEINQETEEVKTNEQPQVSEVEGSEDVLTPEPTDGVESTEGNTPSETPEQL